MWTVVAKIYDHFPPLSSGRNSRSLRRSAAADENAGLTQGAPEPEPRAPSLSLEMDDRKRALESAAPQPAAKRRINPIPAAPATNDALAASEPAPARAAESRVASNAAETGGGKQSGTATADPPLRAGGGESDRSEDEDEDEESRQARLRT